MKRKRTSSFSSADIVHVITSRELYFGEESVRLPMNILGGEVEIREKMDGRWQIAYPEEGWIPDRASQVRPMTVSNEIFASVEEASGVAEQYAQGRPIKVIENTRKRSRSDS